MPTSPNIHPLGPSLSPMAVVVDFHHQNPHSFKPWKRRCRLLSFPHPDPNDFSLTAAAASAVNLSPSSPSPSPPRRNFHRSLSTPCFSCTTPAANNDRQLRRQQHDRIARVEIISSGRAKGTQALVVETAIALASGALPIPASSGLGGAYFLRNRSNEFFVVIKPISDNPASISILGRPPGSRFSAYSSETGLREVAAYLLDHGAFSGVPLTVLIKISHPALDTGSSSNSPAKKIASIQRFVPHDFDAGDLGPSRFSVASVHGIGILDVRLLNIDRHAGNILVRKHVTNGSYRDESSSPMAELVPIDHGLCLPELLDDPYFEWLHWPQATVPFSEVESEYISVLDPFKDAALLRSELPSLKESAIRILILCTIFLKKAAAEGLCLADIGDMMTRVFCGLEEGPSVLQSLCKQAGDSTRTHSRFFIGDCSSEDGDSCDEEDDEPIVQFEMDCDDAEFTKSYIEDVLDIPLFLRSTAEVEVEVEVEVGVLSEGKEGNWDVEYGGERDEPKLGSITKSLSLTAAELSCESGGSSSCNCISFNRMSEEEWGLFLDKFEQLLPQAFEARKNMGLKQRLGTSCMF